MHSPCRVSSQLYLLSGRPTLMTDYQITNYPRNRINEALITSVIGRIIDMLVFIVFMNEPYNGHIGPQILESGTPGPGNVDQEKLVQEMVQWNCTLVKVQ